MTVAELIEELKKMPPGAPVWIQALLDFSVPGRRSRRPRSDEPQVENVRWEGNYVEIE
jgi:hypothetical protein